MCYVQCILWFECQCECCIEDGGKVCIECIVLCCRCEVVCVELVVYGIDVLIVFYCCQYYGCISGVCVFGLCGICCQQDSVGSGGFVSMIGYVLGVWCVIKGVYMVIDDLCGKCSCFWLCGGKMQGGQVYVCFFFVCQNGKFIIGVFVCVILCLGIGLDKCVR